MRWITFLLLLYLMTALQCVKFLAFPSGPGGNGFFPEILYVPMLAVFYALFAADAMAPLAALACGAMLDLTGSEFLGTSAIPLAIVAWLLVRIRPSLFRDHRMLQMITTLLAILAFGLLDALFRSLLGAPLTGRSVGSHFLSFAGSAIYTGAVAPLFFWLFFRFQPLLGFSPHGPRARGHN